MIEYGVGHERGFNHGILTTVLYLQGVLNDERFFDKNEELQSEYQYLKSVKELIEKNKNDTKKN